jgi:death-on-curing family protein
MEKLEAAAARPRAEFHGAARHPDLFSKVAALGHGIAASHCFGNGNKRTAFIAMSQMMMLNGWVWTPPPDLVAFVMLRVASNEHRMDTEEIAAFVGAFASEVPPRANKFRYASDGLVHNKAVIVDEPDDFPSKIREEQVHYATRAREVFRRHANLISPDEQKELAATFNWPSDVLKNMVRWYNMDAYREKMRRRLDRRTRCKRVGKRRCPHLGGRTVKKICRPITRCNIYGRGKGNPQP